MDIKVLLGFLIKNFSFSFSLILISFVVSWFLYNYVILGKIKLKDSLFEKDNLAAWIEFIGAFVYPTLYLSARAVENPASENIFIDFLICCAYSIVYIILFIGLRFAGSICISAIRLQDNDGKINLNNEIYRQNNVAAALYSVVLSLIFVNIVKFFDIDTDYFMTSLLRMSNILIFTLLGYIIYNLILNHKTTLFKEIFVDNNVAAGISFLGFIFAVQYILSNAVSLQTDFIYTELLAVSFISLLILGILSLLLKYILTFIIKVDFWKEVYLQNNIGAAVCQSALYIGIAGVIVSFMK